jgi:hypothetical protein
MATETGAVESVYDFTCTIGDIFDEPMPEGGWEKLEKAIRQDRAAVRRPLIELIRELSEYLVECIRDGYDPDGMEITWWQTDLGERTRALLAQEKAD